MNEILKALIGTVARGILWGAGALAAKVGVQTISEDAATGVATFVVAVGLAAAALIWSKIKDKKLRESDPAKPL